MADEEGVDQQDGGEPQLQARFRMELRDSLPGGRAVIGVEQEGSLVWLASKSHVSEQAVAEFEDLFQRMARDRWWEQNWPGR